METNSEKKLQESINYLENKVEIYEEVLMHMYRAIYTLTREENLENGTSMTSRLLRDLQMVGEPINELMIKYNRINDGWQKHSGFRYIKKNKDESES